MKLSLCIATFNEEKFIHYPLDSTYDFVDEVIIVDGGSTDGTVAKVKSYGSKVKVFETDNPKMFHINKQKALEKASGDWILQLDADEAVTDQLKEEMKQIMASPDSKAAYWLPRKNFFLTKFLEKGGVYPDYTIRFYKNGAAHFPCKSVHENVAVKGEVGYIKNPLLHYADPEFSRYLKRWHRYNDLDVQEIINRKKSVGFFSYIFGKPIYTFFMMYFRHRGFMDGFPGFVFALFSSIRFWDIYWKASKASNSK